MAAQHIHTKPVLNRLNNKSLLTFIIAFVVGFSLGIIVLKNSDIQNSFQNLTGNLRSSWEKVTAPKIDYTFQAAPAKSGFALLNENKTVGFRALIGRTDSAKTPQARFEVKDSWVDFSLADKGNASTFQKEKSGNRDFIVWKNVLPDADFTYQMAADGLKEQIILNKPTLAEKAVQDHIILDMPFYLTTYNVVPRYDMSGKLTPIFIDSKTGDYRFHIDKPYLVDAKGVRYDSLSYELIPLDTALSPRSTPGVEASEENSKFKNQNEIVNDLSDASRHLEGVVKRLLPGGGISKAYAVSVSVGSRYLLKLTLPRDWLADKNRAYPVIIDPTITHNTTALFAASGSVYNRAADSGSGSSPTLESTYHELPADINTVGLWHMNEASGNAADSSGNSNTGTPTGTTVVAGKIGNARSFNGTSDYVSISSLNNSSYKPITYEAWVKPNSTANAQAIIGRDTSGNSTTGIVGIYNYDTGTTATNEYAYYTGGYTFGSNYEIVTGQWNYIVFTWASDNTASWYVNGVLTRSGSFTATSNANVEFRMGARASNDSYYNGVIDEVRISNTVRTPEEIKQDAQRFPYSVYTSPVVDLTTATSWTNLTWLAKGVRTGDGETPISTTNLVAQWNFNETSGTSAASGGTCGATCNGTLTNFASTASQDQAAGTGWTSANKRWGAGALMFDGTNDYVDAGNNSSLSPGSGNYTVTAWFKTSSSSQIDILNHGNTNDQQFIEINAGKLRFVMSDTSNNYVQVFSPQSSYNDGNWHFAAMTYTISSHTLATFVDGVSSGTNTNASVGVMNPVSNLQIGMMNSARYFNGVIDAVQIYSRALTAGEILANYQAGNVEFQTRTSADNSTWEAWKPVTNETAITAMDADQTNWSVSPSTSYTIAKSDDSTTKIEGTGSMKVAIGAPKVDANTVGLWHLEETSGTGAYIKDAAPLINSGTGADGACTVSSGTVNINTASCAGRGTADTVYFSVTANTAFGQNQITLSSTPTGLAVNDEVLIINLQGTSGSNTNVGQYETQTITAISTNTLTLNSNLINAYDGTTQKIMVQRVPNYTNVTVNASTTLTVSGWDGTKGGILFFRANGTVTANGSISANALGYRGGAGGTTTGGTNGESYDGTVGAGGTDTASGGGGGVAGTAGGGGSSNYAAVSSAGTRGGGGGGGNEDASSTCDGAGGAGGGGYGGGGGGGGGGADASTSCVAQTGGTGGTGGSTDIGAGGGGSGSDSSGASSNGGNGGNAGSAGANGSGDACTPSTCPGGAAGSGITTGQGGSGSTTTSGVNGAGGAGGGGTYGTASLTTLFFGSGGGGGGGHSNGSVSGQNGSNGGGIIAIYSNSLAVNTGGSITSNGANGTASTGRAGASGGGAGGSVLIRTNTVTLGTNLVTATGGAVSGATGYGGGGGAGGVGRIAIYYTSSFSGTTNPSATTVTNNNGTPTGTTVVDGFYGKARSFAGNSSNIITVPKNSSFAFGTGDFSIETWINPRDAGTGGNGYTGIIGDYYPNTTGFIFTTSYGATSSISWWNATNGWISSGVAPDLNTWQHVAVTRTGGTIRMYKNGAIINTTNSWTGSIASDSDLTIGGWHPSYGYLNGNIDEVRISNVARSPEEIAEAYRAGRDHRISKTIVASDLSAKTKLPFYVASDRPGRFLEAIIGNSAYANYEPDANTVGLWHLEEAAGSGAYIKDSSGNGNNGTPTGTTNVGGKIGKAKSLNGTSDYITVANASSLNFGTGDFNIEAWIRPNSFSDTNPKEIAAKVHSTWPTKMYFLEISDAAGHVRFVVRGAGGTTGQNDLSTTATLSTGNWFHVAAVRSGNTNIIYINGLQSASQTAGSGNDVSPDLALNIGDMFDGTTHSRYFDGIIDEVRISNTARTADQIRQAYEIGLRTHPINIDFVTSPQAAYSSGTSVTINNPYGTSALSNTLSVGDTIIFKENVGGTETISQSNVSNISNTSNTYGTVTLTSAPTFPSGGYSTNAKVFKWQREYFDITGSLSSQRNGITRITLRDTDGSQGANVWLDDIRSNTSYISNNSPTSYDTTTGIGTYTVAPGITSTLNRYIQYRAINSSWDTAVSPQLTSVAVNYVSNSPPNAPTVTAPANSATQVSMSPVFTLSTTDPDNDKLVYKIQIATDNVFTQNVQTYNQSSSQTGWSGQNAQITVPNDSYTSGSTATYTVQTPLVGATTYYVRAYAVDPSGSNTWGNASGTTSFTTNTAPNAPAISAPANAATGISLTPAISLVATDAYGDYIRYKIQLATDSGFTANLQTFDETSSQTGWSGQNTQGGLAYTSGTTATYTIQSSLSQNTVYYIRAYAIDPGGANLWSTASSTSSFTTAGIPAAPTPISPVNGTYRSLDEFTNTNRINSSQNIFFTPEDKAILKQQY